MAARELILAFRLARWPRLVGDPPQGAFLLENPLGRRRNDGLGSWPCKNVCVLGVLGISRRLRLFGVGYALIATISGRTPMMLIALVML